HSSQMGEGDSESQDVREMWLGIEFGRPSQGRELAEQFAREFTSIMSFLPHSDAQETYLFDLRETAQRSWILQQTLYSLQEIWLPSLYKNPRYRIRKLTPLETFRLQGFPDEAHQALVDA